MPDIEKTLPKIISYKEAVYQVVITLSMKGQLCGLVVVFTITIPKGIKRPKLNTYYHTVLLQ